MLRNFIWSVWVTCLLLGCGQEVGELRTQGEDIPTDSSGIGREDYLIYGDNSCVVANGIFMKRSGTTLTLYGDNNCPHTTFSQCTGPTIATLAIGGTTTKDDCGTTYRLSQENDSATDYLRIAITYQ